MAFVAGLLGTAMSAPPRIAQAATVTQITNFGSNPSGIGMYLYTPTNVVQKPPILVGVHACHSMGLSVCTPNHPFAQQADKYGFLLICPSAVSSDGCWDVHSAADLSHTGSGDASGIISMVNYVIQNKTGDASRVYVAGHSSGGMMTNVLLGSYPDVFKAGAAYAGVAFACFAQGSVDPVTGWSSTCATGNVSMTGAQWGALVRAAYPGFTGTRPRIQLWHGTVDATVAFHNFGEEIKEWTDVLGVSATPVSTENNALQSTWIRTRYADAAGVVQVEAIQETGQPHNLVINGAEAIHFFGLDGSNPGAGPDGGAGGTVKDGGASDGVAQTDGAGNTSGATGGGTANGGSAGTGGAPGTVGPSGTGGALAAGGSTATGPSASGGSSGPSQGTPGTGGTTGSGSGGSSGALSAGGSSSGCSVVSEKSHRVPAAGLCLLLGLWIVASRRRNRN
jgi:acetylxylan esterase